MVGGYELPINIESTEPIVSATKVGLIVCQSQDARTERLQFSAAPRYSQQPQIRYCLASILDTAMIRQHIPPKYCLWADYGEHFAREYPTQPTPNTQRQNIRVGALLNQPITHNDKTFQLAGSNKVSRLRGIRHWLGGNHMELMVSQSEDTRI